MTREELNEKRISIFQQLEALKVAVSTLDASEENTETSEVTE